MRLTFRKWWTRWIFFNILFPYCLFILFKVDVDNDGSIDFKEFKKMME